MHQCARRRRSAGGLLEPCEVGAVPVLPRKKRSFSEQIFLFGLKSRYIALMFSVVQDSFPACLLTLSTGRAAAYGREPRPAEPAGCENVLSARNRQGTRCYRTFEALRSCVLGSLLAALSRKSSLIVDVT
jgi:hypothetical protein